MEISKCYMCDEPSTSREHSPPKCLFPESKDAQGKNYRKNLITVPSCDLHNCEKSHDDQFLMVSLAGIIGNNSIGFEHRINKVDRAIRRTSGKLLNAVLLKHQKKELIFQNNHFMEVIWGTPDLERLNKCFDHIARAIYHHHFGSGFNGDIRTHFGFLKYENELNNNYQNFLNDRIDLDVKDKPEHGENPDIFFYKISDADQFGLVSIKMCFYGGLNLFVGFIPEGTKLPVNPINFWRSICDETYIRLGDKIYKT